MGFFYTLITVAAGITIVLGGLLLYAIHRDHEDLFAPSHQQQYDDDGAPLSRR